ncbi:MAG: acetyl-CoA carboxylase biotin carboxyl carrier protein [Romboutsia sp.]
MNFSEVKELIQLINESDLSYLEVRRDNDYIKMDKSLYRNTENAQNVLDTNSNNKLEVAQVERMKQAQPVESQSQTMETVCTEEDFEYITSPMVGTFYKAISPDEPPFVIEGQKVSKGQVLCIVEAMKLMNEIVAEFDCEIVSVEAENGKMVEYSQPMFKIRR